MFFRKNPEILVIEDFIGPNDVISILDFLKTNNFQEPVKFNLEEIILSFSQKMKISQIYYIKKSDNSFRLIERPNILEFYCYGKGDFLTAHSDKPTKFISNQESNYTAIIYLNDDFIGGETYFTDKNVSINPKAGSLLLFQHQLKHEGKSVELGTKYIFRANWKIK